MRMNPRLRTQATLRPIITVVITIMAAMVVAMAAMVKAIILEAMILSTISHRGIHMDMDMVDTRMVITVRDMVLVGDIITDDFIFPC